MGQKRRAGGAENPQFSAADRSRLCQRHRRDHVPGSRESLRQRHFRHVHAPVAGNAAGIHLVFVPGDSERAPVPLRSEKAGLVLHRLLHLGGADLLRRLLSDYQRAARGRKHRLPLRRDGSSAVRHFRRTGIRCRQRPDHPSGRSHRRHGGAGGHFCQGSGNHRRLLCDDLQRGAVSGHRRDFPELDSAAVFHHHLFCGQ